MRNKLHQRNLPTEPVFFTESHFSLSFSSILFSVFSVPARISLTLSMDYPNTPPGKALRPSNGILPTTKKPKLRLFQSDEKITENECGFLRYFFKKGIAFRNLCSYNSLQGVTRCNTLYQGFDDAGDLQCPAGAKKITAKSRHIDRSGLRKTEKWTAAARRWIQSARSICLTSCLRNVCCARTSQSGCSGWDCRRNWPICLPGCRSRRSSSWPLPISFCASSVSTTTRCCRR